MISLQLNLKSIVYWKSTQFDTPFLDHEFKAFAVTESYAVQVSEGQCISKNQEWYGILVTINEHQSADFTQAFCIDPREYNGTKDDNIKLIGDNWNTVEIMAIEDGDKLQILVLQQETKASN